MNELRERMVINQGFHPINPLICGRQDCATSHAYGPATRHYWLLHFVVSGKGIFRTERGEYTIEEGGMFIIRPHEVTYYEADKENPWHYIWLSFTSEMTMPPILHTADVLHMPALRPFFEDAWRGALFETEDRTGAYETYLCGIIWQILGILLRQKGNSKPQTAQYIRSAITMIETQYHTALTVESMAERLHLNRSYFCKIFKEALGLSPKKYLERYRMQLARDLLCRHGCSVTVTAVSVGFPDVFSFSRAFKRYFGYPPSALQDALPSSS